MLQYTNIFDRILSGGIDQESPETSIKEGFVEDALNMDVDSAGLSRRKGFEVFAGDMPLRAETIITEHTGVTQTIQLLLPSYVNLSNVTRGPLRIQGSFVYNSGATTVTFGGSAGTDVPDYYDSYLKPDSFTLEATSTSLAIPSVNTGITTLNRLVGVQTVADDSVYLPDSLVIDTSTYETTINYSVTADTETYLYSLACETGTYYMPYVPATGIFTPETFVETALGSNIWECTITAATLSLPNLNIIPQFYSEAAGIVTTQHPDIFSISGTTGDITFTFNTDAEPIDFIPVICSVDRPVLEGTTAGTVGTTVVTIENAESPHLFAACYLEDPLTGDLELVWPESILYNALAEEHTITFIHPNLDLSYKIVYEYGYNLTNQIIIEMPVANPLVASEIITEANVVLHGFKQSELPIKTFVNFLDGHRSSDRIVTGADGLLFTSQIDTYSEEIDIRRRISGPLYVGPLFVDSTPALPRTRGNIITSGATNGYVRVSQVYYTGTDSNVAYLLVVPDHGLVTGVPIHLLYDRLTIAKLTQSRFNGNFEILDSSVIDANSILVTVDNPNITNSIWDLPSSYGLAGIFTDQLTFLATRPLAFEVGDTIALSDTSLVTVTTIDTGNPFTIIVDEVVEPMKLATGLRLGPTRTDSTFYLNTWDNDLVIGDIIYFNETPTQVISIDGTAQTITLRESVEITGGLATISRPFTWLLIPSPLGEDIISRTEIISSVSGAGSIYLSNGIKYDGNKVLKSGLPSLQNHLFVTVDENDAGIAITVDNTILTLIAGPVLSMANTDNWAVGDIGILKRVNIADPTIIEVDTETVYLVDKVTPGVSITLNSDAIDTEFSSSFDLVNWNYYFTKFVDLSYYVRLRYIDDNGSISVGPSTGEQDIRVRLTASASVYLRAQVFPDINDLYDYDNIQLDLYRRLPGVDQTSYRIDSKTLNGVATGARYIDFRDSRPIGDSTTAEIDPVTSPQSGRIGESRSAPPFAADWITSTNNQIIYGGITTEPSAYIVLNGAGVEDSDLVGHVWDIDGVSYKVVDPATNKVAIAAGTIVPTVLSGTTTITNATLAAGVVAGDVIYIANDHVTSTAATTKFLGWFTVISSDPAPGTDEVVISTPGITVLNAYEDRDLVAYFDTGFIPLAGDITHYNIGQSTARSTSVIRLFPLHLASAITWAQIEDGIYARGGYDLEEGLIKIVSDIPGIEITLPNYAAITSELTVFGNDRPVSPSDSILTISTRYGSRVALSTKNFPEVFEDLDTRLGDAVPLIADISPEDGEDTNGGIPFFATAAFGAAQQTSILTIFKPHSIYIMDAQAKYINKGEILKQIQSNGVGCEAPKSLVTASDGVWFASRGGMYMLDRSLTVRYIGLYLERLWKDNLVDRTLLNRCAGSNYSVERKYRVSFPTLTETKWTSGVFNFKTPDDIAAETSIVGSGRWTRYGDEFSATLWANLTAATLFSSSEGFVGVLKNTSTNIDFSDAGSDIAGEITFRAMDFRLPANKKVLRHFSIYYRTNCDFTSSELTLQSAVDLSTTFVDSDIAKVNGFENSNPNLLGDVNRFKLDSLQYSPATSKCTWFQLKMQITGINKDIYIDRVIYKVARIRTRGIEQAGERS